MMLLILDPIFAKSEARLTSWIIDVMCWNWLVSWDEGMVNISLLSIIDSMPGHWTPSVLCYLYNIWSFTSSHFLIVLEMNVKHERKLNC